MSNPSIILDCISAAKDIVVASAALVTAGIAYAGLDKWRSELRGRADFDTARRLALATYRLRNALRQARDPLILGNEFPSGYHANLGRKDDDEESAAWRHIYSNRWAPVMHAVQELDAAALEAEASMWQGNVRQTVEALRGCTWELRTAMESKIDDAASGGQIFRSNQGHALKTRQRLSFSVSADDNPLNAKIDAAVRDLEDLLRPHLARGRERTR